MTAAVPMVELWRGRTLESLHTGHVVICDAAGAVVASWGDPGAVIFPRSSCKMIQALPLVESGAARTAGLTSEQLALACASHRGAAIHTDRVAAWLAAIGKAEGDLRCGPQVPGDAAALHAMIRGGGAPSQLHNNCSGKHAGFLTLTDHLGAGPDYVAPDHPVQTACRAAFEEVTGEASPDHGIDGCSAPNLATTLHGLARAMAGFAAPRSSGARAEAQRSLVAAMMRHPDLVAGEDAACTVLMRALDGRGAVKTGAEGVYVAILPDLGLGVALKIADGATRAAECAVATILVRLGALDAADPAARRYMAAPIRSRRGALAGEMRPAPGLAP